MSRSGTPSQRATPVYSELKKSKTDEIKEFMSNPKGIGILVGFGLVILLVMICNGGWKSITRITVVVMLIGAIFCVMKSFSIRKKNYV